MAKHRMAWLPLLTALLTAIPGAADVFHFATDPPDGRMAMGSRPASTGKIEIEAADDFLISNPTTLTHATFTGLLTGGAAIADVGQVAVEIYRVFPLDSTNPPSGNVPTRANSPSDVVFASRDSSAGTLTFATTVLSASFAASNSVLNGIHPLPNQTTGGDGPVTGQEVQFDVTFNPPIVLAPGHYFFVPQVQVTLQGGEFYWLSSANPIAGTGTPFTPDLQSWIRDENLDPDWLRVGTDIVGGTPAPTFNGVFSLDGTFAAAPAPPIPALSTFGLIALSLALAAVALWRLPRARVKPGPAPACPD